MRFTGGRNGIEYLLAHLGIRQKNGAPRHPQTLSKIGTPKAVLAFELGVGPSVH